MSEMHRTADVVVIGGGIIGCACAWRLAARDLDVVVLERDAPGTEATWAAGGMLSPLAEAEQPGPFLDLAMESFVLYDAFVAAVEDEAGMTVDYRTDGKLQLALDDDSYARLEARQRWQADAGFRVDLVDGDEARRIEPALGPHVMAALVLHRDHHVDNRLLGRAVWLAAQGAGARFVLGADVSAITSEGGRATGVVLGDGRRVSAPAVLLAAGAWSGEIQGLPRALPVSPVRGQMIALETSPPLIRHVLGSERCYVVPRSSGRIVVGSTSEHAGFRQEVTAIAVRGLIDAVLAVLPELASAPLVETWAGFRPATPDDLPVMGPDPEIQGLHYATGHYRNGILLAPITAELASASVLGEPPTLDLSPFAPDRFTAAEHATGGEPARERV